MIVSVAIPYMYLNVSASYPICACVGSLHGAAPPRHCTSKEFGRCELSTCRHTCCPFLSLNNASFLAIIVVMQAVVKIQSHVRTTLVRVRLARYHQSSSAKIQPEAHVVDNTGGEEFIIIEKISGVNV